MPEREYTKHERIPMQYLIVEAAQGPTFCHEKQFGGATVGCWIKDQTKKNAYLVAKGWIEDHGWVPLSLRSSIQCQPSASKETQRAGGILSRPSLTVKCSSSTLLHTMKRHNQRSSGNGGTALCAMPNALGPPC